MWFHSYSLGLIGSSIKEAYRHEALRQVWMLDMLTPPSYKPRLPNELREATGDYKATWEEMFGEWLKAYAANLDANLRLEALHGGDLEDAADEVDAVKIKLPNGNFEPEYIFSSMLSNQILQSQREARHDVASENDDMVIEEIFQTMEDSKVCEDCDSQDGTPVDQVRVEGHVYSFNCRCFERIVPRDFAELLRNGTDEEKQAALDMDARGLIPDSMAIKDADGNLMAHFSIDFEKWVEGYQGQYIRGQAGWTARAE
jgi:hypothetical protein